MNGDNDRGASCSTMGHEALRAAGVVVLSDCEPEGSCTGHPYCGECMNALSADPYNTVVEDWRPTLIEIPSIFYIEANSDAEVLRSLADRFDADKDMLLIGAWSVEPVSATGVRLQVVVTHIKDDEPEAAS